MIHKPVMVKEVLMGIKFNKCKVFVDATIGTGGHTKKMLDKKKDIKVYGIDIDPETLEIAKKNLIGYNVIFFCENFKNMDKFINEEVDGILFDLGLSSYQIDEPSRGFSYRFDAPLDMRFNRNEGIPCYKLLERLKVTELEFILKTYGEEPYSRRIARLIFDRPPKTTFELRDLVFEATRATRRKVLSRVFQSLRIYVNDELENLKLGLVSAVKILKKGGRICVISYHSLEDRIVKQFFRNEPSLKIINKKPIRPSEKEIKDNPRARSAKLRYAKKI